MKRILPDQVVAAFHQHSTVQPGQGTFWERILVLVGDQYRCCGTTILTLSENDEPPEFVTNHLLSCEIMTARMAKTLKLDVDYTSGFICGWDGSDIPVHKQNIPAFVTGCSDGRSCWQAVQEAFHLG